MSGSAHTPHSKPSTYCAHPGCCNIFIASDKAWPHTRPLCHVHTNDLYEQHRILDEQERARARPRSLITNAANPGYLGQ